MKNNEQVEYFCFNILQRAYDVMRHITVGREWERKGCPVRVREEEEEEEEVKKEEVKEGGSGDCVSYSLHR